ncbi:hypothetical protein QNO07_05100 [Streptomyces sp. 549]|uniref:hypothetical protein n=1 Tax=Streptomyces sp. 549 TaxID=3049076 RepID=UPI0024C36E4F|nr:hypothetical protein [Streptomyces sp. 549]MDK1472812.1 hypothetical protein [Streptomyces sp. 549]
MRLAKQGAFTALAMCAAAAVTPAGTAAAADGSQVPVEVPLESVEMVLPLDAPTIHATVPSQPILPPSTPEVMKDDQLMVPLLPAVGTILDTPTADVAVPLPGTDRHEHSTTARVSVDSTPLTAITPALDAALPLTNPGAEESGMPRPAMPDATLTTPTLQGERGAVVDVVDGHGQSRIPVHSTTQAASQLLGFATGTVLGAGDGLLPG